MTALYCEIEPYVAQWMRNLIDAGHIAPGMVDERSLEDLEPEYVSRFRQVHFCAGVGIWSLALRQARWADDRRIWTASLPCQPFSAAGKGAGFTDERHLWPSFHYLVQQCQPELIIGEQVGSKDAEPWLDLVHDDLEGLGFTVGAVAFPAASTGAPHIRDRLYWMAHADRRDESGNLRSGGKGIQSQNGRWRGHVEINGSLPPSLLGNAECEGLALGVRFARVPGGPCGTGAGQAAERASVHAGGLGDADSEPAGRDTGSACTTQVGYGSKSGDHHRSGNAGYGMVARPGPTNGLWAAADWLRCRDDKWRPVEPGTFPLADAWSLGSRVGMLRAAGNAITLGQAQVFIECVIDTISSTDYIPPA